MRVAHADFEELTLVEPEVTLEQVQKIGELSLVTDPTPVERTSVEAMRYFHDLNKRHGYGLFTIGEYGNDETGKFIVRDGLRYDLPS